MNVYIPYTYIIGDYVYHRRVVPARFRQAVGKTEIKIKIGRAGELSQHAGVLLQLAEKTTEEVIKMAKRPNDMSNYAEMTNKTWNGIAGHLLADPPDDMTPGHRAVIEAMRKVFDTPPPPVITMTQAVDDYIAHRASMGVGASSLKDYRTAVTQFSEFIGVGENVAELDKDKVNDYLQAVNADMGLAYATKQNKLNYLKNFIAWLRAVDYTPASVDLEPVFTFFRLNPKTCKVTAPAVKIITDADVAVITNALTPEKNGAKPWRYWLWLLCLYHGARPGEINQLTAEDIITEISGQAVTPSFRIASGDGKTTKNDASARIVPIHPAVLKAGFLAYVKTRRGKQLFELGTRHPKNGFTQTVNKFYSPFFRGLYDAGEVAHDYTLKNCRSTIENKLIALPLSTNDRMIALRITGRAVKIPGVQTSVVRTLWRHYIASDYTPDQMLPILSQVVY